MEALKNFRKTLDSIPWVIELLLVIFFDGLYGGIYRMTRGDTTGVIIGIVWLVLAYVRMDRLRRSCCFDDCRYHLCLYP